MWLAILLLLTAVVVIVAKDWHLWFPANDTPAAEADLGNTARPLADSSSAPTASTAAPAKATNEPTKLTKPVKHAGAPKPASPAKTETKPAKPETKAPIVVAGRTVVPPLSIEVVTGSAFQRLYPGNDGLRVEIKSGASGFPKASEKAALNSAPISPAAERTPISTEITRFSSRAVPPSYPTLAKEMKVQGAVVLQAVIGSDGLIQDLRILSGPNLLASAAREAVRQWHFKPYLQNGQPVETLAKITVNFVISTS
jgi:protein TonB